MTFTHAVQLLPALDKVGDLIMPGEYHTALGGALVIVRFSINSYPTTWPEMGKTHTFHADIEWVSCPTLPPSTRD